MNGQVLDLKLLLHRHRLVTKGHKGAQVSVQGKKCEAHFVSQIVVKVLVKTVGWDCLYDCGLHRV